MKRGQLWVGRQQREKRQHVAGDEFVDVEETLKRQCWRTRRIAKREAQHGGCGRSDRRVKAGRVIG